jgi:high-affinity iron transporter
LSVIEVGTLQRRQAILAALAAAGVMAVATGCGSGSAASPAARAQRQLLRVTLTSKGCSPKKASARSGPMRFVVVNGGTKLVSELEVRKTDGVVLGEKENVGVLPGSFHLRLDPGHYVLACPLPYGGGNGTLVVHGRPISNAAAPTARVAGGVSVSQLYEPLSRYSAYASGRLATLRAQLATLSDRVREGDLDGARSAWLAAHLSWLRLGQDDGAYGAFGTLGNKIDGTADGDAGTTSSPSFTGFHRVELDLWHRDHPAATLSDTATLKRLVDSINRRTLRGDLPTTTAALDAWVLRCHEILEDALRDSLTQNDDYGSNTDLESVHADVGATHEMLTVLGGLIRPRAPGLVPTAERRLTAIDAALAAAPPHTQLSALPVRTRQRIDAAVGAALETLAPVSELMEIR